MDRMNWTYINALSSCVFLLFISGCAAGNLASEQQAIVNRLYVSTIDLPSYAKRVFLSPQGILEVETTQSEGRFEKGEGQRTLFDVYTGARIWAGDLDKGYMITDTPSPIIVETSLSEHILQRYARSENLVWKRRLEGLFVFGLEDYESGFLLSLSLQQKKGDKIKSTLHGIKLENGDVAWQRDLGQVSLVDEVLGSIWRSNQRYIFAHEGMVFLILENRAVCLSVQDGRVLSDVKFTLESHQDNGRKTFWFPIGNDVLVVSGGDVCFMSAKPNQTRHVDLGQERFATDAWLKGTDLAVSFSSKSQRGVAVLDITSMIWRWQSSVDSISAANPEGISIVEDRVIVGSKGHLHAFSLESGKQLYSEKIANEIQRFFSHESNIILIGLTSVECRRPEDGQLLWAINDLGSPLALFYKMRKTSMTIINASMQATASIAANQSRYYHSMANRKMGGTYSYDPFTRDKYLRLSQSTGQSSAMTRFGASLVSAGGGMSSLIDRKVRILVQMQNEEPEGARVYFLIPIKSGVLNYETNTAKILAVNLEDGTTHETPVKAAPTTCIPTVMVNENLGLIVEAYHKFPFCDASRTIDILKLPYK